MSEHEEYQLESDFSLTDEYKPEPLCPQGNYTANVVSVGWEPQNQAIVWKVTLADNGGVMTDGETPIDGQSYYFRNWLPRKGDENVMSSSGRTDKRQSKINMLARFVDKMGIKMDSPKDLFEAIDSGEWVGMPVYVTVGFRTWQGVDRNEITNMIARPDSFDEDSGSDEVPF